MAALDQTSVENSGRNSTYYHWLPPGKEASILLAMHVVDGIEAEALAGFSALPRRGLEIGGLLLGWVEESAVPPAVHVESSVPFEAEHLTGPSFVLSERDLTSLGEQIQRLDQPGNHHRVVGYYRTQTRVGMSLDEEDNKLIMRYFGEPSNVFLVVKPKVDGPSTAAFFIWEGDSINNATSHLEFPFQRRELLSGGYPMAEIPGSLESTTAQSGAEGAVTPPTRPLSQQGGPGQGRAQKLLQLARSAAIAVFLVGTCTVLGYLVMERLKPPEPNETGSFREAPRISPKETSAALPPANSKLASFVLQAHRQGDALRVTWDHMNPSIKGSDHGLLFVNDGSVNREIRLSQTQLLEGSVLYWPSSADVTFRMQIFSPTSSVSESVRLVGAPGSSRRRKKLHMVFEQQPARILPDRSLESASASAKVEAGSPRNPAHPVVISMETETPSAVRRLVSRGLHPFHERSFKPAQAVRLLQPRIPPSLRSIKAPGTVDVRARIGTDGKIKIERLIRNGVSREAAAPILAAVRHSQFEAAQRQNRPVASHVILHYRF